MGEGGEEASFLVAKPALISLLEQGEEPGALILQGTEEQGSTANLCPDSWKKFPNLPTLT